MKKKLAAIFCITLLLTAVFAVAVYAEGTVTMYAFENGTFERTIEINESEIEAYKNVGWYTKADVDNAMIMYAPPSRTMRVPLNQVWLYEAAGWSRPVTMFSADGRSLEISPYEVSAYEAVGWYTNDGIINYALQQLYKKYKANGDYEEIFELAKEGYDLLKGTVYEENIYAILWDAMDAWRIKENAPMVGISYDADGGDGNGPNVRIWFRNISYKTIKSFDFEIEFADINGKKVYSVHDLFTCSDANLEPAMSDSWVWNSGCLSNDISGAYAPKITEVVFEDGSIWKSR